jgi:hypothetical protein
MSMLDEWIRNDPDYQEYDDIVKSLGFAGLKDFLAKKKDELSKDGKENIDIVMS